MERTIHNLTQGSDAWHQFRLEHFGASEVAAALGLSKKTTRTELLRMKHTGIAKEFSDWVQENVLDRGHETEALARPIVESMIGQDLYPVTYSYGKLSASCDGLTMDSEIAFEHKQYNADLALAIRDGALPDEYQPQCQQVMHVTGAKKLIFVCSDGTLDKFEHIEVLPDPSWVKRIEAGWKQFAEDLANYQHVEAAPVATAAPIRELPALMVEISGSVTASNLDQWRDIVTERIAKINTNLQTDNDFADADAMVKFLDDGEKRIDLVKSQAQANAADIDRVFRALDEIKASMRAKRLELDKLVTRRKESIKIEIMQAGKDALAAHIAMLDKRIGEGRILLPQADFATAIKGKRNLESMRGAVADLVAAKKIEANEIADKVQINLASLNDAKEYAFLFSDRSTLAMKAPDDLALVIKSRIQDHVIAEEKRLAAETARIRAEEEAKAAAEAKIKADQIAREQAEANEMAMQEIMGINQQVVIAQTGRLGVRAGGTIECIRETLAETEAWVINDRFGTLINSAQAAKDRAIASIRELLAKAEQEEAERQRNATSTARAADRVGAMISGSPEPAAQPAAPSVTQAIPPAPAVAAVPDNGRHIRLGEINTLLGFTVTAEFLAGLGFTATQDKNARLYRECDVPALCQAIIDHVAGVPERMQAGKLKAA